MGIGASSPLWRRVLLRLFSKTYIMRKGKTPDGLFRTYVSGGSSLKLFDPRRLPIDPIHTAFIRDWVKPDSTVWDIGANLGMFAFPAALKARQGKVYAFEADPDVAQQMQRGLSLPLNEALSLSVMATAISDTDGFAEFEVSAYGTALSRLRGVGTWQDAQVKVREIRQVPTHTIDMLAKTLAPPTVIKIDVEGAEMKVLEGGRSTISRYRPVMLIEGPRELWKPLGSYLGEYDYTMLDGTRGSRCQLEQPVWDTIAVPSEQL